MNTDELRHAREAAEASARRPRRMNGGVTERDVANVDRWREANPDALRTWATEYGCVVAFWGMRVYYGTCQSCGGLVTARRPMAYHGKTGRWPKNCRDCQKRKHEEHANQARYRMRRRRERGVAEAERVTRDRNERELDALTQGRWRLMTP
jgi:hypothetical protein